MITSQLFIHLGANSVHAERIAEPMRAACALFDLDSNEAIAGLVGQCAVETVMFSTFTENLYYSTPEVLVRTFSRVRALPQAKQATYLKNPQRLANLVYADRYGNGNEASGDGWKYRGRGCIQTTFRDNYEQAEKLTGRPYVDKPELLEDPSDAALSAAAYFSSRGGKAFAEKLQWDSITKAVNPAMLEAKKRALLSAKALAFLSK